MIFKLFVLYSVVNVVSSDAECKSCAEQVNELFSMARSVMSGLEPLTLKNVEVCKEVTINGMKSMKTSGTPCIKQLSKTEFEQQIEIGLGEIYVNCSVKDLPALLELLNIPFPKLPSLHSIHGFGKKKEDPRQSIIVDWKEVILELLMKLDFTNDKFDVLKATTKNVKFGDLKISCEGDGMMMKTCGLITKSKEVQSVLGLVVQFVVKHVVGIVLQHEELKDLITMLNCGEPDAPDDE